MAAAAGLVVALVLGCRLAADVAVLVVVCAWLPLAAWCVFTPRTGAALPVAVGLLAVVGSIWWTLPGQPGDRTLMIAWSALMWYRLPGGIALLAATGRFRWFLDRAADTPERPARPPGLRMVTTLVAAGVMVLGCGLGGAASLLFWGRVGVPSAAELFPLPAGMRGVSGTGPDGANGCDRTGDNCWAYYRIAGTAGESTAALTERLGRHLREHKGWGGRCTGSPGRPRRRAAVHVTALTSGCRPLPGGEVAADQGDRGDRRHADQDGGEAHVEGGGTAVVAHDAGVQPGDQLRHPQLLLRGFRYANHDG